MKRGLVSTPILIIAVSALLAAPAWPDRECALSCVFKSDLAMTLADIAGDEGVPLEAMNVMSDDLFGHMTHQWQCGKVRAWFDFDKPGPWQEYEVVKHEGASVHIAFPESAEPDIHLTFEGSCYKIGFGEQKYYEYFCPSEVAPD